MLPILSSLMLAGAVVVGLGHTNVAGDPESVGFGEAPPKPNDLTHTLTCNSTNKSADATMNDAFGQTRNLHYTNSTETDYFQRGWETRIPQTVDFFDFKNLNDYISYVVIDTRHVNSQPHYHYFTNSRSLKLIENWSATKSLAVVAALQRIRLRTDLKVGANALVRGSNGRMMTISQLNHLVHLNSDNSAAVTFKHIAHPNNAENFVNGWILPPAREKFSSGYGEAPTLTAPYRISDLVNPSKNIVLESMPTHTSNSLSPLTLAESMKRIGVNSRDEILMPRYFNYSTGEITSREQAAALAPALQPEDLEILFYGSTDENAEWTGMSNEGFGLGGYMLPALGGKENADEKTAGKWRIFSKTGTGTSASRHVTEGSYLAHVCLPEFDGGRELTIYFQITAIDRTGETTKSARVKATQEIIDRLLPGFKPSN